MKKKTTISSLISADVEKQLKGAFPLNYKQKQKAKRDAFIARKKESARIALNSAYRESTNLSSCVGKPTHMDYESYASCRIHRGFKVSSQNENFTIGNIHGCNDYSMPHWEKRWYGNNHPKYKG